MARNTKPAPPAITIVISGPQPPRRNHARHEGQVGITRSDGTKMRWRPVYKREFGETCTAPSASEGARYTYGADEDWREL